MIAMNRRARKAGKRNVLAAFLKSFSLVGMVIGM